MCRDKGYAPTKEQLIARWQLDDKDYYVVSYNQIAGITGHPVIMYDGVAKKNTSVDAVWGIVPFWSKSRKEGMITANKSVNARVETVEESRMYKPLFEKKQRCLIPCAHYFKHHWIDGGKRRYPLL